MKSVLFFGLSLLIFSSNLSAQDFKLKIRQAVENSEYQMAVSELRNLESSDKNLFTVNNYDYLLARMAEKRGDMGLAMTKYQAVVNRKSILSEYSKWHLSQIARSSGNLTLERVFLQRVLSEHPNSLLIQAANNRLARSYFESKNYEMAINLLQSMPDFTATPSQSTIKSNNTQSRENLVLLGHSFLQSGKINEAKEIYTKILNTLPNAAQPDDFALEAIKALDEIEVGKDVFGKAAPEITDTEHFRRASIYQFNRNFPLARLHYLAMIDRFPGSTNTPDALYQVGRGFALENSFNEAIKWFERTQSEFPNNTIAKDALSQAASAYSRVNKPKEATSRYQKLIQQFPEADNLERAYLNMVDVERDQGGKTEALKWTAKTREVFKGKLPEAVALFAQIRIRIAENDWANALSELGDLQKMPDLGGTRVPGGTNKNEVAFLRAFVLDQMGRYGEAVEAYLAIPDGRGEYYGWRATERLRALGSDEKARQSIEEKFDFQLNIAQQNLTAANAENIRQAAQNSVRLTTNQSVQTKLFEVIKKTYTLLPAYQKTPDGNLLELGRKEILKEKSVLSANYHQNLADELLFLGLYDEGTPELETALREKLSKNTNSLSDFPPDTAYTLAIFYKRGDMANRAISYIEPQWKNVPADYQIELIPREQIELLYPVPYADSLLKYAPERGVDPRYALSIMRQESRYRADVKSVAAARGLMQFISDTSNKIAVELNKPNFEQDELYNPPTAVLFGSQYLGNLFKQFPNQPQAVAASYNGGEINVARWVARSKTDNPDRYVPEIIFSQSKDYVYKVMANYRVYQIFYDERLKAR